MLGYNVLWSFEFARGLEYVLKGVGDAMPC